jgi:pantoate--beta-alanine ligase
VPGPIVRESDGLAMSSRNVYLDADQRRAATVLSRALEAARAEIAAGETDAGAIVAVVRAVVATEPSVELQYAGLVDGESFRPLERVGANGSSPGGREVVLPIAARVGTTRLLDNLRLRLT